MYELTFTLQQHTPIIHFQHDQEGATLRATEVKPKLDRFILEKWAEVEMGTEEEKKEKLFKKYGHLTTGFTLKKWEEELKKFERLDSDVKKQMYLKNFKWSLDYRIRISPPIETQLYLFESQSLNSGKRSLLHDYYADNDIEPEICSPSAFFANSDKIKFRGQKETLQLDNGSEMNKVRLALDSASFKVQITSWKEDIIKMVKKHIASFFSAENFGTRQSKGFGCYCAKTNPVNDKAINENDYEILLKSNFDIVFRKELNDDWYKVVQADYKLLKAGRGSKEPPNKYKKSALFCYFAKQPSPVRWEKRWLKIEIKKLTQPNKTYDGWKLLQTHKDPIDVDNSNNWNDDAIYEHKYIRALLGLAEQFEFLIEPDGEKRKKFIAQVSHASIERFRSPVTFKRFNDSLYLCANEIEDRHPMLNAQFQIHFTRKGVQGDPSIPRPDFPPTPATFNLPAFLEKALTEYGIIEGYAKI